MKVFRLPPQANALVFDLDNTLYSNPAYAAFQEDSQVARLASRLVEPLASVQEKLGRARVERAGQGIPKTSMANLFLGLGIDMDSIIRWREEEIRPAEWLSPDPALARALVALSAPTPRGRGLRLALLTNNPRSVGMASLSALGLEGLFESVTGLDDTGFSKPELEPFRETCRRLDLRPADCISIGDRMDIDIAPALQLGMGAILVDGPADILRLPELPEWRRNSRSSNQFQK